MLTLRLSSTKSADWIARRDSAIDPSLPNAHFGRTYGEAHLKRFMSNRDLVIAGGRSLDEIEADVIYRVESRDALDELLRTDPYVYGGIWAKYSVVSFSHFIGPKERVPVCADGSRRAVALEGPITDVAGFETWLASQEEKGRLVFGGLLENDRAFVWLSVADEAVAEQWVAENGVWRTPEVAASLRIWVL